MSIEFNNDNPTNIGQKEGECTDSKLSRFKQIIVDFVGDLNTVFPEYSMLWQKWTAANLGCLSEEELHLEMSYLYDYCMTVFPERFFDILYQNDELFLVKQDVPLVNTCFLPNVEFKLLYNTAGISDNTRKTMWKYLQLILFTVVGSIQDKSKFGDSASMFDGVDETELHSKLNETINGISDFFQKMNADDSNKYPVLLSDDNTEPNIPNPDDIHSHLKGLFDGKIGNLAKEMADDISKDLSVILENDGESITSTQDVLKALMKDPSKITNLIKTVGEKLNSKISSGEISQQELLKEAGELLGKMKSMSGNKKTDTERSNDANPLDELSGLGDMMDMFKGMMGNGSSKDVMKMAMKMMMNKGNNSSDDPFENDDSENNPLGGMGDIFKNLAGVMGKGSKIDTNAMDRVSQQNSTKERLRNKMIIRKAEAAYKLQQQQITNAPDNTSYSLTATEKPDNYVFSLDDNDVQLTSAKPVGYINSKKKGKKGKK